ncbi:hypothetical protein, partial [Sinomonas humi]
MYDEQVNAELRDELQPELRRDYFDRKSMPKEWLAAMMEDLPRYRTSGKGVAISLRGLPDPMVTELVWCLQRQVEIGLRISSNSMGKLTNALRLVLRDRPDLMSLLSVERDEWVALINRAHIREERSLPPTQAKGISDSLGRCINILLYAYHRGDWWRLNVWNPTLDARIPLREHEPQRSENIYFSHLTTPWLREAAKWWLSRQLEREKYTWSTLRSRQSVLTHFQRYIDEIGCDDPRLADEEELGDWSEGFRIWLRDRVVSWGPQKGKALGAAQRRAAMTALEQLYRFMYDEHSAARRA